MGRDLTPKHFGLRLQCHRRQGALEYRTTITSVAPPPESVTRVVPSHSAEPVFAARRLNTAFMVTGHVFVLRNIAPRATSISIAVIGCRESGNRQQRERERERELLFKRVPEHLCHFWADS